MNFGKKKCLNFKAIQEIRALNDRCNFNVLEKNVFKTITNSNFNDSKN